METLHDWLISLVPADLILNDTQNVVFWSLTGAVIILSGIVLFLAALYRRDIKVPNLEKEEAELSALLGEEFHDFLVNKANNGMLTRKQYKWASRKLKAAFPGGIYGYGSLSDKTRKQFHLQVVKDRVLAHQGNGFNKPSVGLQAWQRIVAALNKPQPKKPKFNSKNGS